MSRLEKSPPIQKEDWRGADPDDAPPEVADLHPLIAVFVVKAAQQYVAIAHCNTANMRSATK